MTDFETLVNVIGLPYKLYEAATVEVGESKIKDKLLNAVEDIYGKNEK